MTIVLSFLASISLTLQYFSALNHLSALQAVQTPNLEISTTPVPSVSPSPAPQDTTDWLTYKDTSILFTFKYPKSSSITMNNQYLTLKTISPVSTLRFYQSKLAGKTLEDIIRTKYSAQLVNLDTVKATNVGELDGYSFDGKDVSENWFLLSLNDKTYLEILTTGESSSQITDTILSTINPLPAPTINE